MPPDAASERPLAATANARASTNANTRRGASAGNGTAPGANAADREPSAPPSRPGSRFSWLHVGLVLLFNAALMSMTVWLHYSLPTPKGIEVPSVDSPAHFSELKALEHIKVLSEDIGYRIVGTEQHVRAEKWLESVAKQYEGWHRTAPAQARGAGNNTRPTDPRGDTQVEVWTQMGDGAHRFDLIGETVFKKYYSMSNVIVRISDGTDEGKEHALLINAHLDSTLPSPGAADDGAGVAIMIDLIRILTTPPRPRLRHAVVLLFNNGEESLQDGSHLYSTATDEPTLGTVRGVINLEAAGTAGPSLLFQATSIPFIEAFSTAPNPFGTVLANDVFSTGLLLSDTDFRQFVQYANLSGLDMAIVGNSYYYHTRADVPKNLQPGTLQHFGDNTLAIVDHLCTSPRSRLARNRPFSKRSPPIYFSLFGRYFVHIPSDKYRTVVMGVCALANYFLTQVGRADKHFGALPCALASMFFSFVSLIAALIASNAVAAIMTFVLKKPLSWYTHEDYAILLFGPPAATAVLATQYVYSRLVRAERKAFLERSSLDGMDLFFVLTLLGMNAVGIGSSYLSALGSLACTATIAINDLGLVGFENIDLRRVAGEDRVHPWTYLTLAVVPATVGVEGLISFLDLFVPLTGRTGEISPADHIVGSIVGTLTFLCLPLLIPLAHRMGSERLGRVIVAGTGISTLVIAIFASPAFKQFDAAHPKRIFVHAVHNITSEQMFLNLGGADPDVPGIEAIVHGVHEHMGIASEPFTKVHMDEYNHDFAVLYPVSTFLTPYKMRLPMPAGTSQWTLPPLDSSASPPASALGEFLPVATEDEIDWKAGTRRVTITLKRPDLIWSVMAFDADILEWDLPTPPPKGPQRHHLKEVARHGHNAWSVSLLLRLPDEAIRARKAEAPSVTATILKMLPGANDKVRRSPASANVNPIREGSVPERDPSRLWIDYSALVAEGMWPQAASLGAERRALYPSLEVLSSLDEYLLGRHPEVDSMLLSVVAGVAQV